MMVQLVKFRASDINPKGAPPEGPVGYLAPSVGTFTLFKKIKQGAEEVFDTRRGQAAFIWSHRHEKPHDGHTHEHLVLDWHSHDLEFAGTALGDNYWVYSLLDPFTDAEVKYVLFARKRTDSGGDHGSATDPSDIDEGYRVFYVVEYEQHQGHEAHEETHLWAWDARTFVGHHEAHDH